MKIILLNYFTSCAGVSSLQMARLYLRLSRFKKVHNFPMMYELHGFHAPCLLAIYGHG